MASASPHPARAAAARVMSEAPPAAVCRSCGARIRWASFLSADGRLRPVPLDIEPVAGGNIDVGIDEAGRFIAHSRTPELSVMRWQTHFVTCPQARQWRGRRR